MTQQTWQHAHTRFPAVRRAMGRERTQLDDQQLEALLSDRFGGVAAEDVEAFMRDVQRFATHVAPVAQRVLVGAASGAATGAVGGLPGIIAGAAIGGTLGGLSGSKRPTPTPSRSAPGVVSPPQTTAASAQPAAPSTTAPLSVAATTPTVGAARRQGMAAPRNNNAAAQLLMLLSRPETSQALLGLLMNRQRVPLGNQQVPAAAFANALAEMASLAAEQAAFLPPSRNAYYFHVDGTPRCNLADDTARAQLLFNDLFGADVCQCSARGTSV